MRKLVLVTVVAATAALFLAANWSHAATINCHGGQCLGTSGNDTIYGTAGIDTIYGQGGSDNIFGQGGNDTIYGGDGPDYLYGDAGSDHVWGQGGSDSVNGGTSYDWVYGGDSVDTLTPGPGSGDEGDSGPGADTWYTQDGYCEFFQGGPFVSGSRDQAGCDFFQ